MRRGSTGFTLIELLIIVVIIGISLSLALPGFQGMIQRNRMATQVNDFLLAINMARSEAMRRGSAVTIQSADNGAQSVDEFGNGYCVQLGIPGASGFSTSCTYVAARCASPQTTGCILRQFEPLSGNATLNSVENVGAITFGALGQLDATTIRSVDMCDTGTDGRRIRIALVGRAKSLRPDDPDASRQPGCV